MRAGKISLLKGKYEDATKYYEEALKLEPKNDSAIEDVKNFQIFKKNLKKNFLVANYKKISRSY